MFKHYLFPLLIIAALLLSTSAAYALPKDEAEEMYTQALLDLGMSAANAGTIASGEVESLIASMQNSQSSVKTKFNEDIKSRIDALPKNDPRREKATKKRDDLDDEIEDFTDMNAENHLDFREAIGGVPPAVVADADFIAAEEEALAAIAEINRLLIAPARPGAVPEGDLIDDFIPQLIRQLFRFAYLMIFVALVVSGIMMIIAQDNEERLTKARQIITWSLIGFAVITLAFAVVQGITDLDFFALL
jgi:hypothetical protein